MTAITHSKFYTFTCKFCVAVRNVFAGMLVAIIAFGEQAGRSRAASELARMGYYDEAKNLMLNKDTKNV